MRYKENFCGKVIIIVDVRDVGVVFGFGDYYSFVFN